MKKILNSNGLKIGAIIAMVLDHIAYLFVSPTSLVYFLFRAIGRITLPIMCIGIANGYFYTRDRIKYGRRLLICALLSQVPYSLFLNNKIFLYDNYNVIFTLFLGFLCLCCAYDLKNVFLKTISIISCLMLAYFCEYNYFAISLIFMFSIIKSKNIQVLFYTLISFGYVLLKTAKNGSVFFVINLGLYLIIPLLYLYNGEKGKCNLKYLFYIFYPLHLIVLFIINLLLG